MKLINNGQDSFRKGITLLKDIDVDSGVDYEFKIKDVILNLHHSIEALFKYIVYTIDKDLLLGDMTLESFFDLKIKRIINEKPQKEEFDKTIKFIEAVNIVIVLKDISISKWDYYLFINLRDYRNAITHYEIAFEKGQVEYLIAKILPLLYKIFLKEIPEFEEFSKKNKIDTNIEAISEEYDKWSFKIFLSFLGKIAAANGRITYLDQNRDEIGAIFDGLSNEKTTRVQHEICPVCNNDTFLRTGTIIVGNEEKIYYGACKYCGIDLSKDDAKFVLYNVKDYKSYNNLILTMLPILLNYPEPLSSKLTKDQSDILYKYYLENETEIIKLSKKLISTIIEEHILEDEADDYRINHIDFNEKYAIEIMYEDKSYITIEHELDELQGKNFDLIFSIVDNFNTLSRGNVSKLNNEFKKEFEMEFLYDYPGTSEGDFEGVCFLTLCYGLKTEKFLDKMTYKERAERS